MRFSKIDDQLGVARGLMSAMKTADVLLIGGNTEGRLFDAVAAFAPSSGESPPRGTPSSLSDHALALATASNTVEVFDPATQAVYFAGYLTMARSQLALAPMGTDQALVIGGMGSDESILSAEVLNYRF